MGFEGLLFTCELLRIFDSVLLHELKELRVSVWITYLFADWRARERLKLSNNCPCIQWQLHLSALSALLTKDGLFGWMLDLVGCLFVSSFNSQLVVSNFTFCSLFEQIDVRWFTPALLFISTFLATCNWIGSKSNFRQSHSNKTNNSKTTKKKNSTRYFCFRLSRLANGRVDCCRNATRGHKTHAIYLRRLLLVDGPRCKHHLGRPK